jgi:bifunctional DNase/RNase
MHPSRPLTHDLFKKFAENFDITVVEVVINKFIEGVFHSVLICKSGTNVVSIDARTSDAVAIALRFDCPIFALDDVIEKTAIELDDSKDDFLDEEEDQEEEENEVEENDIFDFNSPEKEIDVDYLNTPFELIDLKKMKIDDLNFFLHILIQEERYENASTVRDELKTRNKA